VDHTPPGIWEDQTETGLGGLSGAGQDQGRKPELEDDASTSRCLPRRLLWKYGKGGR
jgi:hypothetical protein